MRAASRAAPSSRSADPAIAGAAIGDDGGASADAVAVAIVGIGEGQDRLVGNRLDQAGAEHGIGSAGR